MNQLKPESEVIHLTEASFKSAVIDDPSPILIDFWAPWCGPCRMMTPIMEDAARELQGQVRVAKLNVDEAPGISQALGIRGIPALLLVKESKVIHSMVGVTPLRELVSQVRSKLK